VAVFKLSNLFHSSHIQFNELQFTLLPIQYLLNHNFYILQEISHRLHKLQDHVTL
jgi:hypothetical protein